MAELDAVVVAAPMQPPHAGHHAALVAAAAHGVPVFALILGAEAAPTLNTPWSARERSDMLLADWPEQALAGVLTVRDVPYDRSRWQAAIAAAVGAEVGSALRIGIVGDAAPPWPATWQRLGPAAGFAARERCVREALLAPSAPRRESLAAHVSAAQLAALLDWHESAAGRRLREEADFIRRFRDSWAQAPYPPVFVTVDALVTWRDEILLIERERAPGKGLWALPGGFIDTDETLEAGARRELAEETGLVAAPVCLRASRVFDAPQRSLRGRTITHAFHYDLSALPERPAVAGADDASAAAWVARDRLTPARLFEDHYAILQVMAGLP